MVPVQAYVFFGKHDMPMVRCPFCSNISEYDLQYEDYVTLPMLWCTECGARSVLDCDIHMETPTGPVDLLYIERVKCNEMTPFICDQPVPDADVIRLFESNFSPEVAAQLGITTRNPESEGSPEYDYNSFHVSLPCMSYNAEAPIVPYPAGFSLDHDGVVVELLCRDRHGRQIMMHYWGD